MGLAKNGYCNTRVPVKRGSGWVLILYYSSTIHSRGASGTSYCTKAKRCHITTCNNITVYYRRPQRKCHEVSPRFPFFVIFHFRPPLAAFLRGPALQVLPRPFGPRPRPGKILKGKTAHFSQQNIGYGPPDHPGGYRYRAW
jgi:hypothetical protein